MKRAFFKDGIQMESPASNVYFHFNENCIQNKDSYFLPSLLFCPADLKPHLKPVDRERLSPLGIQCD
ncbi:hypothetical protein DPMN_056871 [Dreissena polymorpha]|uniref:Uncharacterized protein n=1 Tax=Dreissena polymorpha TaxID=45954 RepID=A0A9D4HRW9_DREPO|nr:hypothetical protein DPMN_056871 [Dreissena polymorpha]